MNKQVWAELYAHLHPEPHPTAVAFQGVNELAIANNDDPPFTPVDILTALHFDCLQEESELMRALTLVGSFLPCAWHALHPIPGMNSGAPSPSERQELLSTKWALDILLQSPKHEQRAKQMLHLLTTNANPVRLKTFLGT